MPKAVSKKRAGNMASVVYDHLRSDILNGVLLPGTPLSQLTIANASGTSRGPVREALRRLQQDQLVHARTNHRFNVAPFDVSDLESVLSLHLSNVTLAIRISVPFLTDGDIQHLRHCVELMNKASRDDETKWDAAYRDFILSMVRHAGPRIASFIEHLIDNIQRYRKNTLSRVPRVYSGGPEFDEIFQAAATRDGKLASARYVRFISRMSALILAGIAPHYDAARLRGYVQAMGSFADAYRPSSEGGTKSGRSVASRRKS